MRRGIPSRRIVEEADQNLRLALPATQVAVQLIAKLTR
jgi:hypothetical protein